jgi:hypothetical protein
LALQEVDRDQPRSHLADLTVVAAEAMGAVTHRFAAALSGTPGATWIAASRERPSWGRFVRDRPTLAVSRGVVANPPATADPDSRFRSISARPAR